MPDKLSHALIRSLDRAGVAARAFRAYERIRSRNSTTPIGLPPATLRYRVFGLTDPGAFDRSGREAVDTITSAIEQTGGTISGDILDFGIGAGRVAQHWRGARVHGADYNPELVAWCQRNLPHITTVQSGLAPPLPFAEDTFNVIYAVSVFTHLTEVLQHAWIAELRRVAKPDGRIVITTHGEPQRDSMLPTEREQFDHGELVVRYGNAAGTNLCSTYHPRDWVLHHLAPGFDVLAVLDGNKPGIGLQDIYVLRPE